MALKENVVSSFIYREIIYKKKKKKKIENINRSREKIRL
jgi:hypothetical protein